MSYTPPPNPYTLRPIRWLVRHHHTDIPEGEIDPTREEVVVSYHGSLPDGLASAISTASRYEGALYAEVEEGEAYVFVRSYVPPKGARQAGSTREVTPR